MADTARPSEPFRPGDWRNERTRRSVRAVLDDSMVELIEDLRGMHPVELLAFAAQSIAQAGVHERDVRHGLARYPYPETAMLMVAMGWLADRVAPETSACAVDVPGWLRELDQGRIVGAMRRKEPSGSTSYLVELGLVGGWNGCLQVRVDGHGAICNAFAMRDDLDSAAQLLQVVDRGSVRFRTIKPLTAQRSLRKAREAFDAGPLFQPERFNPWPMNRALIDFVLDHFEPS